MKKNRWMKWVLADSAKADAAEPLARAVKAKRKPLTQPVRLRAAST